MKIDFLQLDHFRGLKSVRFDGLGRINLVVGGNNTGKTSVLEALCLLFGDHAQVQSLPGTFRQNVKKDDWQAFWRLLGLRGEFDEFMISSNATKVEAKFNRKKQTALFRTKANEQFNQEHPFILFQESNRGHIDANQSKSVLKLSVLPTTQPDPLTTSRLFNEIAPLNPENETKLEELLCASIEPRLRRLRYAKPKGAEEHLVYADLGNGPMVPFTQMGQAFARALHIYCEIFALQPDILLVDEIENGLYYGGLEDFWKGLIAVLEDQDVQLFATTHSRECMEAACKANQGDKTSLRYLRLDRKAKDPETIVGTVFNDETMAAALESGREMR
ncbi:MAG: AAA family ATPase [Kiritimatiellia bacterium]